MELPSAITPPAPTPAAAAAPAEPVAPAKADVTPTPAKADVKPADAKPADAKPADAAAPAKPEKRKSITDSVGDKYKAAIAKEKADKAPVADPPAKPADAKPADAKPADKPVLPAKPAAAEKTGDKDDAALAAEIEVETAGMEAKAKKGWSDLRYAERKLTRELAELSPKAAKAQELEAKLAAVEAKLAAAGNPTTNAAYLDLQAKLEAATARDVEREGELMIAKVERTAEFANAVTKPLETINALAKKLAKKYELSEATILSALHDTSDKQSDSLIEACAPLNEIEKQQLYAAAVKVSEINEKAEVLRTNAAEALAKIEAKKTGESEKESATKKVARDAEHAGNWKALQESLPSVLAKMEGDDPAILAWNQAQADAETFAKTTDYSAQDAATQSSLMQRAAVYPLIVGALTSYEAQLAESKAAHAADLEELTKFRAKVPGAGADRAEGASDDPASGVKGFVERTSARFAAAGYG